MVEDGLPNVSPTIHTLQETNSITEWYASSALSGRPRRRIVPTWYKERERAKDPHQPLADGWTRHEATAGLRDGLRRLFPDGCGSHVYQYRESKLYWYYPFRVPSIQPSTPFCNPAQMRYLFCKTWKSTVLACRRFYETRVVDLRQGPNQPVIGALCMHSEEQFNGRPSPYTADHDYSPGPGQMRTILRCRREDTEPSVRRIEVVAINRAVVFAHKKCDAAEQGGSPVTRKEYVTVLWVKWQDTFYTRLARGQIEREAWESLDLEEIDLVLG